MNYGVAILFVLLMIILSEIDESWPIGFFFFHKGQGKIIPDPINNVNRRL